MSEANTVDFHVHCTDSTARSVIDLAAQNGLVGIGLVQRVSYSPATSEYIEYGKKQGVEIWPGVEFTMMVKGQGTDLIVLGFNPMNPDIAELFNTQNRMEHSGRIAQMQRNFLENRGFEFDTLTRKEDLDLIKDLLSGQITEKAISWCRLVVKGFNNRDSIELLKSEFPDEWREVLNNYQGKPSYDTVDRLEAKFLWAHYFAPGKEGYIPVNNDQLLRNAVKSVHEAEGLIVYSPEGNFNIDVWKELKAIGVDGVMGWHGGEIELSPDQVELIEKQGKLILGGSDYDPEKEDWKIGRGNGRLDMPADVLVKFRQYVSKYKK